MKIAIVKPDYKIVGGFEIVVNKIIEGLIARGNSVDCIKVDMTENQFQILDVKIPEDSFFQNQEFFNYTSKFEKFEALDLEKYDLVITTQPPSFAVDHPKVVMLFYHHMKIYYDLYDAYIECGFEESTFHENAMKIIRRIDNYYITNDKNYIAGSEHVKKRLIKFNEITKNIYTFAAGIDDDYFNYKGETEFNAPICVGRHEFPKRPELFIHAMKHVEGVKGKLVGQGGRTEDLKIIDKVLTKNTHEGIEIDDEKLWKQTVFKAGSFRERVKDIESDVVFTGRVTKEELIKEYADAMCVVCPAYEEDYGLTAIEAMAFGKPVIVCNDGGGYMEFIENGKNGFIVEPSGKAIAEAINYLKENPGKLKEMGENAYKFSRKYSWEKSLDGLDTILKKIHNE